MSVSIDISGEIIESRNYLSNYFVTINSDQTIYGNKLFNNVNVSNLNTSNISTNSLSVTRINASSLDISTNLLTFNGNSFNQNQIFGSSDISSNLIDGTIYFGKTFDQIPCVTISQYSNRIVPICITNITTTSFNWASSSSNIGKINWSAGIKF
jgi:hypothetical protein